MSSLATTSQTSLSKQNLEQSMLKLKDIYDQRPNAKWWQLRGNTLKWIFVSSSILEGPVKSNGPTNTVSNGQ